MKYATDNGNVGVRWVDRPDVISKYFAGSNAVDKHNHVRQFELGLEKCWITHNPYFRLFTTLLGINVVDCWKLSSYHGLFQGYQSNQYTAGENAVPIKKFASILAKQLLTYAELLRTYPLPSSSVPCTVVTASSEDPTSSLETSANGSAHPLIDKNGFSHCPILFEKCPKNKRVKPRHCSYCSVPGQPNAGGWARHYCNHCLKAFCCPTQMNSRRNCFKQHVDEIRRDRRQRQNVAGVE